MRPFADGSGYPQLRMADDVTKVVIHKAGSYDRLRLERAPMPVPKADEVVVDVRGIGVNYADVIVRMGLYASAKELVGWPITPGFEVSGTVGVVGKDVTEVSPGDRVIAGTLFGGYTSALAVPQHQVFKLPDDISFEEGAGIIAVYLTGWFALHFLAHPRPGDRVLVHSAAGGVGSTLVQLAKRIGCEVTGVVGRTEKVAVAEGLGCDHVIDKSREDLWARAERISDRGFDVVLDANGVATLKASYDHLRPAGKLVVYGFATMMPKTGGKPNYLKLAADYLRTPRYNPLLLTNDSKSVLAFNLSYLFDRVDLLHEAIHDILRWMAAGELKPPQVTTFPLADVAEAHKHIESGKSVGKLILIP
ncbi:MAG: medium chain dehydrogenase/reductase family protein [Myxococcota bacterium]